MNLQLDDKKIENLIYEYLMCKGDESYFYHIGNYLLEELEKQYPKLFKIEL